eukprot:TRINITY_DN7490_c0_g1_i1.p2 TRINITY_DN7490_c0_g1~~TRINITY_DN7490_c0_g1_i1.p2  ORF type:complete len:148 (-),score=23.62 TRINITY_DN7490_c0_g1_i1:137-580(-)
MRQTFVLLIQQVAKMASSQLLSLPPSTETLQFKKLLKDCLETVQAILSWPFGDSDTSEFTQLEPGPEWYDIFLNSSDLLQLYCKLYVTLRTSPSVDHDLFSLTGQGIASLCSLTGNIFKDNKEKEQYLLSVSSTVVQLLFLCVCFFF